MNLKIRVPASTLLLLSLIFSLAVIFGQPSAASAQASKLPDKLHWDVSLWATPKSLNHSTEQWAADMKAATNGRWEIVLHYGEVLAKAADGIDGLKGGAFEAAVISTTYIPGKTPLKSIIEGPFMAPEGLAPQSEWAIAIGRHPAVVKEMDSWNVHVMFDFIVAPYEFVGKKPLIKVEDFNGLRVRLDTVSGLPIKEYGAVLNNIPGPDIYNALDRGLLDSVCFVWPYTFGAYKMDEICKFATLGIGLKISNQYLACTKKAWAALPAEWKKLSEESSAKAVQRYIDFRKTDDIKWLEQFKKSGMQINTFPPEERAKLVAKAAPSWEKWVKEIEAKGLPGREMLNFALAKSKEISDRAKK